MQYYNVIIVLFVFFFAAYRLFFKTDLSIVYSASFIIVVPDNARFNHSFASSICHSLIIGYISKPIY